MTDSASGSTGGPKSDSGSRAGAEARKVTFIVLGLTALLSVMLTAFALPAIHSGAHGVPIGVVGAQPAVQQVEERLQGFDVETYQDPAAAREAVLHREVYGALVIEPDGVHTLIATAASNTAAQSVQQVGTTLAAAQNIPVTVTELRSFPSGDPRGAGLSAGALPLALGGWIAAVLIMQTITSARTRIIAMAAFSIVGGLALTAVIQFGFGTFDGNYGLTSLAAMLGIAATAMGVLGLRELFGFPGLGVAAVLLILLGNPLSGLTSAPEMLPKPWGFIGQLLPPGATGSLLRDVGLFDGHGATHALIVLSCWLIIGVVCYFAGVWRQNRSAAEKTADPSVSPVSHE